MATSGQCVRMCVCVHLRCTHWSQFSLRINCFRSSGPSSLQPLLGLLLSACFKTVRPVCRLKAGVQHYTILERHEDTVNQFTAAALLYTKIPLYAPHSQIFCFLFLPRLPYKYTHRHEDVRLTEGGRGHSQDKTTSPTLCQQYVGQTKKREGDTLSRLSKKLALCSRNTFNSI